jgi:hypothetical protein
MENYDNNLIRKFFDNELSQEEVETFKTKYHSDPDFRKEINDETRLYAALKATSNINEYKMSVNPGLPKVRRKKRRLFGVPKKYLRIAAVVIPLAVLGTMFLFFMPDRKTADSFVARGIDMTTKTEDYKGFTDRWGSKSEQVQQQIDKAILSSLDELVTSEETYYFGIKSAQESRFNEAVIAFKRVINSGDQAHLEDSEWLLALCYIKTGEEEKAKTLLEKMADSKGHRYSGQSGKLLKKIKF